MKPLSGSYWTTAISSSISFRKPRAHTMISSASGGTPNAWKRPPGQFNPGARRFESPTLQIGQDEWILSITTPCFGTLAL